ncbi:MAG: hypothetical protein ACYC3B_07720 [Sedimentisphaerales bacterium]
MKLSKIVLIGLVCAAAGGVCYADHGHISGAFVRGNAMYNHTITLSASEPNFNANLGGSNAAVYSELWAVAGAVSPDTGPGSGVSQVYHAYDQWYFNHLHLGDPSGGNGTIIYHFAAAANKSFAGGTVKVNADYRGDTPQMWVSTSTVRPTGGGTAGTVGYWNTIVWSAYQTQMFDQYNVAADYTVNIPAGREFWVAVSKPSGAGSVYAQLRSVLVQATVIVDPNGCVTSYSADLNSDCKVNFKDFAVISEKWLNCSDADNPQECPGIPGPDGFPWETN